MSEHYRQKLMNWGEWMRRGESGGLGYGQSVLANLMGRSDSAESSDRVPVIEIDASLTDDAVRTLAPELQRVAYMWFVKQMTVREVARRTPCSTTTVRVRVDQLMFGVQRWFEQRVNGF